MVSVLLLTLTLAAQTLPHPEQLEDGQLRGPALIQGTHVTIRQLRNYGVRFEGNYAHLRLSAWFAAVYPVPASKPDMYLVEINGKYRIDAQVQGRIIARWVWNQQEYVRQ